MTKIQKCNFLINPYRREKKQGRDSMTKLVESYKIYVYKKRKLENKIC